MTTYAKLTENCEWEGETWRFYIPIEGNQDALAKLAVSLKPFADQEPAAFELDLAPIPEAEVDALVKHGGDTTYLAAHTKLDGTLVVPEEALNKLAAGEEEPLYKGEIRELVK